MYEALNREGDLQPQTRPDLERFLANLSGDPVLEQAAERNGQQFGYPALASLVADDGQLAWVPAFLRGLAGPRS